MCVTAVAMLVMMAIRRVLVMMVMLPIGVGVSAATGGGMSKGK